MMGADEAKREILNGLNVSRQRVMIAKAFMLKNFVPETERLIQLFLRSVDARMPEKLVLHPNVDPAPNIKAAIDALSWKLAACEGIWGLISSGAIFPVGTDRCGEIGTLEWTTIHERSGGMSSGFSLQEISLPVPNVLAVPRSHESTDNQPLTDPDLYIHELAAANLPPEIEAALREAVKCLRSELFLACLAMLGRASEAAWIDLGLALCAAVPTNSPIGSEKTVDQLQDSFVGIGKKIQTTIALYERQDIFGGLSKASGIKLQDLRNCVVWADCVRDARNSIHYGAEPAMSNSYEKVVALLIGAVPHIRLLITLTKAAKEQARA